MTSKANTSVLVTGGSGQIGQSIQRFAKQYPDYQLSFPAREQLDLTNKQSVSDYFNKQQFDVIINCAAHTAVDRAESESELANQLNHLAVKQLAGIANKQQAKLIHISTDYVFSGENHKPYVEDDVVNPQGVYGLTKLKGEQAIQSIMPNDATIIRTSWVYSQYGNNFVKTMLKLGEQRDELNVIFDQIGTPTYAGDLAQAILQIIHSDSFKQPSFGSNLYHYSNEGVVSWYDFAKSIFELADIDCIVNPIETKDYPMPAKRPNYSVLNKAKIKQSYSLAIPYWKDGLQQCLKTLQENE